MGMVRPEISNKSSETPKRDTFFVELAGFLFKIVIGTGLELDGGLLVKAFNVGYLACIHIGHFLDGGEAFGSKELGNNIINIPKPA